MEVVKSVPDSVTFKYCLTTFIYPFALEKLSHHLLMVHLNLDPEIFVASPCSTYDMHIPTPAGTFIGLLGPFGHLGFFGLDNCSSTGANNFPKRKVKSDYTSSKKRKMNPSFSLEQFFLKFPILEEKICNQLNHQSLITITKASKEMMDISIDTDFTESEI